LPARLDNFEIGLDARNKQYGVQYLEGFNARLTDYIIRLLPQARTISPLEGGRDGG